MERSEKVWQGCGRDHACWVAMKRKARIDRASYTGMGTRLPGDLTATKEMRERGRVVMRTVLQRRGRRWQWVRHHQSRDPHGRQCRCRTGDRTTSDVGPECDLLAREPSHPQFEQILPMKADRADRRRVERRSGTVQRLRVGE